MTEFDLIWAKINDIPRIYPKCYRGRFIIRLDFGYFHSLWSLGTSVTTTGSGYLKSRPWYAIAYTLCYQEFAKSGFACCNLVFIYLKN